MGMSWWSWPHVERMNELVRAGTYVVQFGLSVAVITFGSAPSFLLFKAPTMASAPVRKLSGLQKDVLSLYRSLLRVAVQKDRASSAAASSSPDQQIPFTTLLAAETTTSHARAEFRRQCAEVKRSDFRTIEYLVRKGRKHVKLLQMPGVKGTSSYGGGGAR